jgi:delta8-fatty-acid desaturase
MDVDCPEWLDFFHGGLHMQISHHLFPRIPRHRLREVSVHVKRFAEQHREKGTRYESWEFVEGNKKVLSTLEHVARQVKVLVEVAKTRPELH